VRSASLPSLGLPYEGRTFRSRLDRSKFAPRRARKVQDVRYHSVRTTGGDSLLSPTLFVRVFSWWVTIRPDPYPFLRRGSGASLERRHHVRCTVRKGLRTHLGATATTMESCSGSPKPGIQNGERKEKKARGSPTKGTRNEKERRDVPNHGRSTGSQKPKEARTRSKEKTDPRTLRSTDRSRPSRRNEGEKPKDREQDRGDAIGYVAQTGEEGNDERLERRTKRLHRPTKHHTVEATNRGTRENEAFFQTTGSDTLRPGKQERESRTKRSKHASRSFHRPTKHHAVDTGHKSRSPEQATKDVLLRTVPSSTSLTVVCSGASYRRGFEGPLPSFASDSFRGTTVRSGRGESPCSPRRYEVFPYQSPSACAKEVHLAFPSGYDVRSVSPRVGRERNGAFAPPRKEAGVGTIASSFHLPYGGMLGCFVPYWVSKVLASLLDTQEKEKPRSGTPRSERRNVLRRRFWEHTLRPRNGTGKRSGTTDAEPESLRSTIP